MKKSQVRVVGIISSFLIAGMFEGAFCTDFSAMSSVVLLHGYSIAMLCYSWAYWVCEENSLNSRGVKMACGFIAPIGVPWLLFQSKGVLKGAAYTLLAALIFIASLGLGAVGTVALCSSA